MTGYRTVTRFKGLFLTFRHLLPEIDQTKKFVIMCYGCPSHPYDHAPFGNQKLLKQGYTLVYVDYFGTRGSDGICDFDNTVDSVLIVIELIERGFIENQYNDIIKRSPKEIVVVGASFGGSVALCAGALSQSVSRIISCSPIVNWSDHNKNGNETSLNDLVYRLKTDYSNLWRCSAESYQKLADGKLNIDPSHYQNELSQKNIFIVHGKNDSQVDYRKSQYFIQGLKGKGARINSYFPSKGGHVLLHHLDDSSFHKKIADFLDM